MTELNFTVNNMKFCYNTDVHVTCYCQVFVNEVYSMCCGCSYEEDAASVRHQYFKLYNELLNNVCAIDSCLLFLTLIGRYCNLHFALNLNYAYLLERKQGD